MAYCFWFILAVFGGLAVILTIISVTFVVLPQEKLEPYKQTVKALFSKAPRVNLKAEVTYEAKTE